MSYYTMSNKELSQLIRKTLKESGFTSKDLSVRVRAALYDTSVNITIKNPLVRISEVEEIVKRFSEVDYDEHSGEILAGCNVYVHCQYEYGIFKDAAADLLPVAEMVLSNKEKYSGTQSQTPKKKAFTSFTIRVCNGRLRSSKKIKTPLINISLHIGLIAQWI